MAGKPPHHEAPAEAAVAIENSKMFEQTKAMQLHYESILTSIPDIVMTLDGEGRLTSTNHELNVVFGMTEVCTALRGAVPCCGMRRCSALCHEALCSVVAVFSTCFAVLHCHSARPPQQGHSLPSGAKPTGVPDQSLGCGF